MDNAVNLQYRFGMPGPVIEESEWLQLLQAIEKINAADFIVASGSVPAGVPLDIFARMAFIAKKKKAKFIVDTSGEALQHAADEGVYLLKPNLGELSLLAGKEEINTDFIADVPGEIIAKGKCEVVVVSIGATGAMVVTKDIAQQITAPIVKRKSTVGAGDSMVAGIVLSLAKGRSILAAAKYGVAAGTAATINPGTELCRLEDVEKLFAAIRQQVI